MKDTDEALMAAYQRGDVSAFERLVARHEKPVWGFLYRYVGNAAVAEDLLQEVFLRVVRNAGGWKPSAKFSTWMYTIARNLTVDHARRMVHREAKSLDAPARGTDADGPTMHDALATNARAPEAAVMDRQLAAGIDAAVASLPPDQREVFLMRETLDMPFAEIAQTLGVAEPTVKSRMRYALEKLRAALTDFREPAEALGGGA